MGFLRVSSGVGMSVNSVPGPQTLGQGSCLSMLHSTQKGTGSVILPVSTFPTPVFLREATFLFLSYFYCCCLFICRDQVSLYTLCLGGAQYVAWEREYIFLNTVVRHFLQVKPKVWHDQHINPVSGYCRKDKPIRLIPMLYADEGYG